MTINVNCPPRGLFIGRETENVARTLAVDFSAWAAEHGPGTLQVLLQRPGDSAPYPVTLTVEGTVATWKPSETDLAEAGTGAVQLVYTTAAGVREKTQIIPVMVEPSLGVESDPPEGWTSWIDQLTDLAAETEQHAIDAAESAENAAASAAGALQSATDAGSAKNAAVAAAEAAAASVSHYPQIVGGVWYVWSPTAGEYISTGIDAQGEDGVSPTVEITAIQGGHRVVITDAEGPHTFDVMDGVTPDLSAYRTAADQDEIDDAQDEQIDDLKSALDTMQPAATSADVGKALIVKTVEDGKPTSYEYGAAGGGGGGETWYEAELTAADYDSTLGMILFDAGDGKKIKEIIAVGQIVNDGTQTANETIAFGFGMTKSRNNYSCPAQTSVVASTSRRLAFQCHFRGCIAPAKTGTAYTFFPDAFFYGFSSNADHSINVDTSLAIQGTQRSTNFYGNFNDSRYFKIEIPSWVPEWATIKLYYTLM